MEISSSYRTRSSGKIRWRGSPRFLLTLTLIILYFSLYYIYQAEISPSNLYLGFRFRPLTPWEMGSSLFFFLLPISFLPIYIYKPSDLGIWCLYLFSYSPTSFIAFHIGENDFFNTITLLLVLNFALILLLFFRRVHFRFPIMRILNLHGLDMRLLLLIFVLAVFSVSYLGGFSYNLDFANVYERRFLSRDSMGLGAGYLLSLCRSVLTIVAVYLIVVKKKFIYFLLISLILLAIFSLDGTKGTLLNPVFLAFVLIMVKHYKSIFFLPLALGFLTISGIVEYSLFHTNIINQYLVRRILIIPGFLNAAYWDYFSDHEKVFLTDSFGKYFFEKVNVLPTAQLIGLEYFQSSAINANTGIWMGGFAHFGLFGVLIVSVFAGLLFGVIDNLLKIRFSLFGVVVCTYVGLIWSEQMMHTSLLTGGVFYVMTFIFCIIFSKHLGLEFSDDQLRRKSYAYNR